MIIAAVEWISFGWTNIALIILIILIIIIIIRVLISSALGGVGHGGAVVIITISAITNNECGRWVGGWIFGPTALVRARKLLSRTLQTISGRHLPHVCTLRLVLRL